MRIVDLHRKKLRDHSKKDEQIDRFARHLAMVKGIPSIGMPEPEYDVALLAHGMETDPLSEQDNS